VLGWAGLAVESCLKYLTGKRVLEEGTELAGIAESVVEFYQLARGFCYDLRLLGLLELVRALYAIAALQRVFGPLSVPVRTPVWAVSTRRFDSMCVRMDSRGCRLFHTVPS
jgi:hypothetical protein